MHIKKHLFSYLFILIAIALLSGFLGWVLSDKTAQETEVLSINEVAAKVSPATVSIIVTKDLSLYKDGNADDFFSDPFFDFPFFEHKYDRDDKIGSNGTIVKIGIGSGFIITSDGLILTNKHVVSDPKAEYTVVMSNGGEYTAEVVIRDPTNDIAIIKITDGEGNGVTDLPVVELGSSGGVKVGQSVVAIGNALTEYGNTVTTGVIIASGRDIKAGTIKNPTSLTNLLQTNAEISAGHSGGPLVNLAGQVIGINVAIASEAQGTNFAIPIDDVKPMIESVQKLQ